jgi:hypothetical protein
MLVEDRIGFIPCTDIDDALEDVHSRVSMCLDGNSNPAAKAFQALVDSITWKLLNSNVPA